MDVVRAAWKQRLGLTRGATVHLRDADLNQLSHCRSDEARRILVASVCGKKPCVYRHMPPQFRSSRKKIATPGQLNQIALNWHRYGADTLAPLLGVSRTLVRRWAREAGLSAKTGARRGVPILSVRGTVKQPVALDHVDRMMELAGAVSLPVAFDGRMAVWR